MLKLNRKIAIVMAFVFCLSFMAPAFISPSVAEAAFTATVAQSNYVSAAPDQNLGYIKVEVNVADWSTVSGDQLLVSYPTRIGNTTATSTTGGKAGAVGTDLAVVPVARTFTASEGNVAAAITDYNTGLLLPATSTVGDSGVRIVVPNDPDNAFDANPDTGAADIFVNPGSLNNAAGTFNGAGLARAGAFTLTIDPTGVTHPTKDKGWFYIYFARMDTSNFAGDVNVSGSAPERYSRALAQHHHLSHPRHGGPCQCHGPSGHYVCRQSNRRGGYSGDL
jgi:hypothetical protein